MFVYNDLLALSALDRYFFICTRYRFNGMKIFIIFYVVSALLASPISLQLFLPEENEPVTLLEIKHNYDEYFMSSVAIVSMLIACVAYVYILVFVYTKSFLSIVMVNFRNESRVCVHVKKERLSNSQSSTDNINITANNETHSTSYNHTDLFESNRNRKTAEYSFNLIHFKIFKKMVHWKITFKFMQVCMIF